jgi:uncharacterized protein (TIGR03437 family)
MKKRSAIFLSLMIGICLQVAPAVAQQAPVDLASDSTFAVLGGTTVTVTGAGTITGNVGIFPGTAYVAGTPPVTVKGTIYAGGPVASQAQADLASAFNDAAGRSVAPITISGNIGGLTLAPGLYKSTSSLAISSGDLTLDAGGDANAVWIFQIASTLTTTSGLGVILAGGANPANIFWQVGTSATIGTTSVFQGNILAAVSISMLTGSTITGRALAMGGAVTIDTGGGSSASLPVAPAAPPTVISSVPLSGAQGVTVGGDLTASFSVPMAPLTITTATFTLEQGVAPVSGAVTYNGTTATFAPTASLLPSTSYTATITTNAQDLAGDGLTANYVWSFTTAAAVTPPPAVSGTVDDASYVKPVVAGSIAAVFGTNLSVGQESSTAPAPLPMTLAQSSSTVGGTPAPLYFAMPTQVNLQVPWELAGQTQASIVTTVDGAPSAAETVALAPFAPGIFSMNAMGSGQGAVLIASTYQLAGAATPVTRGTYVAIFCTGLGAVTNQPATGTAAAPGSPLSVALTQPTVTIGGASAVVSYAGLAPGFVGLYQVNALVPSSISPGSAVPLIIVMGPSISNTVTIAVQ